MISVIIPCYNVENYIAQCLESIVAQTCSNLEIVCVNDGSTDGTLRLLEKFAAEDERIMIFSQQNAGLSAARNAGIHKSTGVYLMFVDADDWLEPDAVEKALPDGDEDLVCFSYNRIFQHAKNPRDLKISGIHDARFIQRRITGLLGEELKDPSQADSLVTAWGKLYNAEPIRQHEISFTDTKVIGTEDALFNVQFLKFASKVKILNLPLYNYRKSNFQSLTSAYKPRLFEQWQALYSMMNEVVIEKGPEFRSALRNRICLGLIGLGLNECAGPHTLAVKKQHLQLILNDQRYVSAFRNLEMQYFPLHWKIFFYLAKKRYAMPLLLMLLVMNRLINIKN